MILTPIPHAVSYANLTALTVCPVIPVTEHVKKPKRIRTNYTETQINEFEKIFVSNQYPSRELMDKLSSTLDIPVDRMRTWFQNRRSRQRKARQCKTSKNQSPTTYHNTGVCPVDMESSLNCFGRTTLDVVGGADERGMKHQLYAHTTPTPTTNQACMNCDSKTVYSSQYHHPVMSPGVVRSPRSRQLDNYPNPSNRGSYFGNQCCYGNQSYMPLPTPVVIGYTFQQTLNHPHTPQNDMNLLPNTLGNGAVSPNPVGSLAGQQIGGNAIGHSYSANSVLNRNTPCDYNDPMYSFGTSNSPSAFSDNINAISNLLVNVGQLQLSSYHMQVNSNEQTWACGNMDNNFVHQLGSRCLGMDRNSFTKPVFYQHVVCSACYTPPHQFKESDGSHSTDYPCQVTASQDLRSCNFNHLSLSSQSSTVDSQQIPEEGNFDRARNEMSNSGFKQHFRPERETNLNFIQACDNSINHSADTDMWSSLTSQDSDSESLGSFGSNQCIPQIDMTASLLSELSPYGPMSAESFRGDTPLPDI